MRDAGGVCDVTYVMRYDAEASDERRAAIGPSEIDRQAGRQTGRQNAARFPCTAYWTVTGHGGYILIS